MHGAMSSGIDRIAIPAEPADSGYTWLWKPFGGSRDISHGQVPAAVRVGRIMAERGDRAVGREDRQIDARLGVPLVLFGVGDLESVHKRPVTPDLALAANEMLGQRLVEWSEDKVVAVLRPPRLKPGFTSLGFRGTPSLLAPASEIVDRGALLERLLSALPVAKEDTAAQRAAWRAFLDAYVAGCDLSLVQRRILAATPVMPMLVALFDVSASPGVHREDWQLWGRAIAC
jgi:hypothetical protein